MGVGEQDGARTVEAPPRLGISAMQVAASALAAASAAVVASLFGVGGTVIGAALVSIVATTTSALYRHWARRTTDRLTSLAGPLFQRPDLGKLRTSRISWRRVALAAALVFTVALASITVVELFAGKSISALLGRSSDAGPTVENVIHPGKRRSTEPSPAQTRSPTATPSPSPRQLGRSASPTPRSSSSPSQSPTAPSGSPSPTGSASASPTTGPS